MESAGFIYQELWWGFVLGIAAGLIFWEKATKLAFLGTILTRLLTMVVAPLVLGLFDMFGNRWRDFKTLGKIGGENIRNFFLAVLNSRCYWSCFM